MEIRKITYDKLAEAMYISLKREDQKFGRTLPLNDTTILDLDADGNIIGIEILFIDKNVSPETYIKSLELLCREPFSIESALNELKTVEV